VEEEVMRKQHPDNITKWTKVVRLLTALIQLVLMLTTPSS
jgi:hypothetical protein